MGDSGLFSSIVVLCQMWQFLNPVYPISKDCRILRESGLALLIAIYIHLRVVLSRLSTYCVQFLASFGELYRTTSLCSPAVPYCICAIQLAVPSSRLSVIVFR
jgi:hypothetical protein